MRLTTITALLLVAGVSLLLRSPAAQAQPELIYIFPKDGATLAEAPTHIQLCFAKPVNIHDLDKGGDFRFRVIMPDATLLGLRIVFQTDGYGVVIYPGPGPSGASPNGEWTFEWRVTEPPPAASPAAGESPAPTPAATLKAAEGTATFTVDPTGEPAPQETPPPCSPGATPGPGQTPEPTGDEEDGGPDILFLALITTAAVAGAVVLGGFLYLVRQRIGFWLHRPPPRDGDGGPAPH